jgi:hypothetical protein
MLLSDRAQFDLAKRLRNGDGVTIAEVFTFLSGLYFRGKNRVRERVCLLPRCDLEIPPGILAAQKGFLQFLEIGLAANELKAHLLVPTV